MKEWIAKIKREVQPPSPIGVSNRVILKLIAEIEKIMENIAFLEVKIFQRNFRGGCSDHP